MFTFATLKQVSCIATRFKYDAKINKNIDTAIKRLRNFNELKIINIKSIAMNGKRLKGILAKYKVSQSEIAKQLGMSHQSLNQMLSASDIKTGLVERIAKVLNVSISSLYGEDKEQNAIASGNGIAVAGNNNVAGNVTMGDNSAVLQERVTMLEKLLEEKERTIKILMER